MNTQDQTHLPQQMSDSALILPLSALDASQLPLVGGKGANLGELIRAGLPVPQGFCVTTAAYKLVSRQAMLTDLLDGLAATPISDINRLQHYAAMLHERLLAVTIPPMLVAKLQDAYQQLTSNAPLAVAVRSSATAEDLPFASFAGQQDTFLNVLTFDALLDAVRRCWASLWNDRAVSYRANNAIDVHTVHLAVVVQQMVNASVAGVLFTANPLTGRRQQAVIDANPGLGEAVVSGAVTPDHFVVNTNTGEIVERHLGEKRLLVRALPGGGTEQHKLTDADMTFCLADEQIATLAQLGKRVEAHFGAPQDTEWAIDDTGKLWLTQARPITTLYPLPASAPTDEEHLRVYLSLNVAQGVYRPFTPMGAAFFHLIGSAGARMAGFPPQDLLAGPTFVVDAGDRLFLDFTPMFRSTLWHPILLQAMGQIETRSGSVFRQLASDPRLTPVPTSRQAVLRKLLALLIRTHARPLFVLLQALFNPAAARARQAHIQERLRSWRELPPQPQATPRKLLATIEQRMLIQFPSPSIMFSIVPIALIVFGLPALAKRLLQGLATEDEIQMVRRGLPHNPTTEMDLKLWQLAQELRAEPTIVTLFRDNQPAQLTQAYRTKILPTLLQQGLADFLALYGHRGVAEIDMGLPRWSDDPTYLFGMLTNYMQLDNADTAPDVQFQRGVQEADAMVQTLIQRARRRGWLYGQVTALCLHRMRDLLGLREVPKFDIILMMAAARRYLVAIGEDLAHSRRLEAAKDIFFITLKETHAALAGQDMRALVQERRASYERELGRRHIPRVMLSDGTEPEAAITQKAGVGLRGTPASAGIVSGKARVILDPAGAHLEPGEILVAPSTDPGWTPLFFTASGLVMEMGGPISHGAIVAREYGIPAVVGVSGAIEQITTGQMITVDGSRGIITLTEVQDKNGPQK